MNLQNESIKGDRLARKMGGTFSTSDEFAVASYSDFKEDWYEFKGVTFSYGSSGRILYDKDLSQYLDIGDIIRWEQFGDYKYAYVMSSDNNGVNVFAGDDYLVANSAITEFSIANTFNPSGFPKIFTFTAVARSLNSMTASINLQACSFSLEQNLCSVNYRATSIHLAGSANSSYGVDLPIRAKSDYIGYPIEVPARVGNGGVVSTGYIVLSDDEYFNVNNSNGGNFTTGLNSSWLGVQFNYQIDP